MGPMQPLPDDEDTVRLVLIPERRTADGEIDVDEDDDARAKKTPHRSHDDRYGVLERRQD